MPWRARDGAAGRVSDHAGEVADQKDDGMSEILEVLELAEKDGMSKVKVRRSGIEAGFYAERFVGGTRAFQFRAKFGFADYLSGTLLDVGELLINGRKVRHRQTL